MDPKGLWRTYRKKKWLFQGKGGSMHMFSKSEDFYGGHGIVAAQVPIGAGLAFANKYKNNQSVCFTYYGDGAANQGQIYKHLIWLLFGNFQLFFSENNQYAMGTSIDRASSTPKLFTRGEAFDIPGRLVDGMDVLEVSKTAELAASNCRSGDGPYILEMNTYRYKDILCLIQQIEPEKKFKILKIKDPIENFQKHLLNEGLDEDEFKKIDKEIKEIVSEAADFALESSEPNLSDLYKDIYLDN